MLEDSSTANYTHTLYRKADMAKMMSSLASSFSDLLENDKKKGGKKGKSKEAVIFNKAESANMETTTCYKLDKVNMLVTEYFNTQYSDMNTSLAVTKDTEVFLIRKTR